MHCMMTMHTRPRWPVRRTNIMPIARRFILTNPSCANLNNSNLFYKAAVSRGTLVAYQSLHQWILGTTIWHVAGLLIMSDKNSRVLVFIWFYLFCSLSPLTMCFSYRCRWRECHQWLAHKPVAVFTLALISLSTHLPAVQHCCVYWVTFADCLSHIQLA